jgi:hypothetical protein
MSYSSETAARIVDPVLTGVAQGYRNPDFVGASLFPMVEVGTSSGQIIEFDRAAFVRHSARRAPGSDTKRVPMGYFGRPYSLVNEALDAQLPRELHRDAKAIGIPADLGIRSVNVVMRALRLGLEIDQAALARNAANYIAANKVALSGTDRWDNFASADPLANIEAGMEAVRTATGMFPNVMLIPSRVFRVLRRFPAVREMYAGTNAGALSTQQLAQALSIERVVVAGAVRALREDPLDGPAPEGIFEDIWGTDVILAYAPERPSGAEEPSFGYTYTMRGHPFVEQPTWDGKSRSWIYGVTYERVPVLAGMAAGYLIQTATTPPA